MQRKMGPSFKGQGKAVGAPVKIDRKTGKPVEVKFGVIKSVPIVSKAREEQKR